LQKDEIERRVKELLAAGLITLSNSPFASHVLLLQKKDGTWCFCIDYRKLDDITMKNRFPMPIIDEILGELAGTKYLAKMEMRSGYHQVRMKHEDECKTAFKTVTPSFKGKIECIDHMCARIKLHTRNDIVNTKISATRIKSYYITKVLNET
jgi:hypothetical protein